MAAAKVIRGTDLVSCARNSSAYVLGREAADHTAVAANALRLETITAAVPTPMERVTGLNGYVLTHLDAENGKIYGYTGNNAVEIDTTTLAITVLVDCTALPGWTAGWDWAGGVRRMADGSILLWVGRPYTTVPDGSPITTVYRGVATDGVYSWSVVDTSIYGGSGSDHALVVFDQLGNAVAWGTYQSDVGGVTQRNQVHYSADCGATWDVIHDATKALATFHSHATSFVDAHTIFVVTGDAALHPICYLLTKPVGWEPGDGEWTVDSEFSMIPCAGGSHGNGYAAGAYFSGSSRLIRTDLDTLESRIVLAQNPPYHAGTNAKHHYRREATQAEVRAFWGSGSTVYCATYGGSATAPADNVFSVLVSADGGYNWTCMSRLKDTTAGLTICGPRGILGISAGYLWMYGLRTVSGTTSYVAYRVPMASVPASEASAVRLDFAETNCFTDPKGTEFTGLADASDCGWSFSSATGLTMAVVDHPDIDDTKALKVTSSGANDNVNIIFPAITWGTIGGDAPAAGDVFTLRFTMCSPDWPALASNSVALLIKPRARNVSADAQVFEVDYNQCQWVPGDKPQEFIISGKFGTITALWLLIYHNGVAWNLYISDVHLSWAKAATGISSRRQYQIGGTARAEETVSVPIGGVGAAWSVVFDWKPGGSCLELVADAPIATIFGVDGSYIELKHVRAAGADQYKFSIGDGTDNVLSTAVENWHHEMLRFIIASDGADTTVTIGTVIGAALSIDGQDVALGTPPLRMVLGRDNAGAFGADGHFWNFRRFDSVLSAEELTAELSRVGTGIVAGSGSPSAANVVAGVVVDDTVGTYPTTATTQAADASTLTAVELDDDGTDTTVALGASTATIKSAALYTKAKSDGTTEGRASVPDGFSF